MGVQAKHRRRTRRGRPHEQFMIAIAILFLVMAGGMAAALATSIVTPGAERHVGEDAPEVTPHQR